MVLNHCDKTQLSAARRAAHYSAREDRDPPSDATMGLAEVLRAGGWRSAAFAAYIRRGDLEARVVADLLAEATDSEAGDN